MSAPPGIPVRQRIKIYFIKVVSIFLYLGLCMGCAGIYIRLNEGFAAGDIRAFFFWSFPPAVAIAVSGNKLLLPFGRFRKPVRLLFALLTGAALGIIWTLIAARWMGPWYDAFSFSLPGFWVTASCGQFIFIALFQSPFPWKTGHFIRGIIRLPVSVLTTVFLTFGILHLKDYWNRPEPELFLIPGGYRGEVYIVFNKEKGEPAQYEGKRRVFRIPGNGILFTQFRQESGLSDQEYYYMGDNGRRKKLGQLYPADLPEEGTYKKNEYEPSRDSVAVFEGSAGSWNRSGEPDPIKYFSFFVGSYHDRKTFNEEDRSGAIDSLLRRMVEKR